MNLMIAANPQLQVASASMEGTNQAAILGMTFPVPGMSIPGMPTMAQLMPCRSFVCSLPVRQGSLISGLVMHMGMRNKWRASLLSAASVIPAPISCEEFVAVN